MDFLQIVLSTVVSAAVLFAIASISGHKQVAQPICFTNLWETQTCRVREIRIIEPHDIDQALIQPGQDMLTQFNCHSYASRGR